MDIYIPAPTKHWFFPNQPLEYSPHPEHRNYAWVMRVFMSTSTSTPYTRTFCCDVQSWSEIDGHRHIVRRLVFLHHYSSSIVEQRPLGAVIYVFFIIANNQGDGQVMVSRQSLSPTSQSMAVWKNECSTARDGNRSSTQTNESTRGKGQKTQRKR